ncbi:uncharacterized protein MYCFIDRAFT_84555 [Pseudocercospora fijiensis CIRAD86]|uniref:U4/U6.U5 small nuclear ribonucleoprotein 27kDa protein domain-containing protein n=1 Tax=Pseudocercospora fijiensis (strain CIRAD86) TaxID=383855 RepID=M3BAS6_PSEFD|nr:uncharacterized protein MYCFIDRAFT_84555 [Pseudocercospora fijiensis CIRAD86]EME86417.1 hypothetical protein MYCFIDRAFT_84555 [Pseudocercospora fijiensis CIRAD86]
MDRDRSGRAGDRRPPREDTRNHKPRYGAKRPVRLQNSDQANRFAEQNRSRSPPRRDRRDDRRRDRSPPRGPFLRSGPPPRSDRDRDFMRGKDGPPRGRTDTKPNRESLDNKAGIKGARNGTIRQDDTRMEGGVEDEDSDAEMNRIMGFSNFKTTKNTKVPGNDKNYGVHKIKKAEYRQYMNRQGGFNRPLSPSRV